MAHLYPISNHSAEKKKTKFWSQGWRMRDVVAWSRTLSSLRKEFSKETEIVKQIRYIGLCSCLYLVWFRELLDIYVNLSAEMYSRASFWEVTRTYYGLVLPSSVDPWGPSLLMNGLGNPLEHKNEESSTFVVVQLLSHIRLFATPWTAACQASLCFTIPQSLLKLMSIVSMMPPNHLVLCRPLRLLPSTFPIHKGFFNESALLIRWPNYWSSSFSISPSSEYSRLISFRIDWFDLLAVQGTLKSLFQHHSLKASVL